MTWPVPPAVPISPMMARMMSLAVTPSAQRPVDPDPHVLRLGLDQGLGRQHVLDLGGADAVRERPEGAVGRGVAVAADDRRARQGEALLRSDDVHHALAAVELVVIFDAELLGVGGERLDLLAALGIGDAVAAVGRLDVVVDDGERLFGGPHLAPGHPQALERLRARHLVDEMAIDVDEARAARRLDDMVVPDLVIQRTRLGHERVSGADWRREWGKVWVGAPFMPIVTKTEGVAALRGAFGRRLMAPWTEEDRDHDRRELYGPTCRSCEERSGRLGHLPPFRTAL